MRIRSTAALTVAVVAATAALTAAPAQAAGWLNWTASCSAGGLTGSIRPTYTQATLVTENVANVEYKITSNGAFKGNVLWHDGGTAPPKDISTDSASQDGQWHSIPGALRTYSRGNGYTAVTFIFDKLGPDPRCTTGKDW